MNRIDQTGRIGRIGRIGGTGFLDLLFLWNTGYPNYTN